MQTGQYAKEIKMLALDLDGTLLTTDKRLTPYARENIQKALDIGCNVLISTGRPVHAIPEELLDFEGMRYAVTANGARILDLMKNEAIYESLLLPDVAAETIGIFSEYDAAYEVFIDGKGYTDADAMTHLEDYFSNPDMVKYMKITRTPAENLKELVRSWGLPADKTHAIFRYPDEKKEAEARLSGIPGISVTTSLGNDLDVNGEGTDKGAAVIRLAKQLGISRDEIMACGDTFNDYTMLKAAGLAIAMGNAEPEIKAIADYVTDTNDRDGVAKAVKRFIL